MNKALKTVGPLVELQRIVETVVGALVDNQKKIEITSKTHDETSKTIIISIKVAPDEVGKVIGRKGRTVESLRNIMNAAATKFRKRVILEVFDPNKAKRQTNNNRS